jgi:hypothetical protein
MRRAWILPTAGAVLVATATVLGLILFRRHGFFEVNLPELTIWFFVVGPMMAAFLGLLFVEMRAASAKRRKRFFLFGLFGAVCGLIASVVYGIFGIEETRCEPVSCGWSVLGLVLSSAWLALGLLAAVGVVLEPLEALPLRGSREVAKPRSQCGHGA